MMNSNSIFRRTLLVLVVGLPTLLVLYAVVMGGAALLDTLGDSSGGIGLRWVGTSLAIFFVAALIALVFLLGWDRLRVDEIEEEP